MAAYTITLEQAKQLMTPEQTARYNALLASVVPEAYTPEFVDAFNARYNRREISNGTPEGFLEDLTGAVYVNKLELNALWSLYAKDGMFDDSETEDVTETPDITRERTPNLTDERTPDITRKDDVIIDDTPQTSGVIGGGYAANVTDSTSHETGSDKLRRTGSETTTETGTRRTERRHVKSPSLNDTMRAEINNLMIYTLRKFASCFMLLY